MNKIGNVIAAMFLVATIGCAANQNQKETLPDEQMIDTTPAGGDAGPETVTDDVDDKDTGDVDDNDTDDVDGNDSPSDDE